MRLKSYFAGTVEAAMELARKELGDDAMLINAQPATEETRYLGAYEVVCALNVPPPPPQDIKKKLTDNLAGLRRRIDELTRLGHKLQMQGASRREYPLPRGHGSVTPPTPLRRDHEGAVFATDATLGKRHMSRAVVALCGPPGSGKTTTIVKLAARYGAAMNRSVHILSADPFHDRLDALATRASLTYGTFETLAEFMDALIAHATTALLLIDAPSLTNSPADFATRIARMIGTHPEIDTHLVLPASMNPTDMQRIAEDYEPFNPSKVLFSRMDETRRYRTLAGQAARMKLPVSFLATGPNVPDDLEPATRRRILNFKAKDTPRRAAIARAAGAGA
jgi:flagellar biosynthesis GTPase FlhF